MLQFNNPSCGCSVGGRESNIAQSGLARASRSYWATSARRVVLPKHTQVNSLEFFRALPAISDYRLLPTADCLLLSASAFGTLVSLPVDCALYRRCSITVASSWTLLAHVLPQLALAIPVRCRGLSPIRSRGKSAFLFNVLFFLGLQADRVFQGPHENIRETGPSRAR